MTEQETSWSFDREDVFKSLGFNARERRLLQAKADDFVRAILEVHPPDKSESSDNAEGVAAPSAPLYISGVRYHLNLSQAAKTALLGAFGIIAKAFILQNQRLLELSVTLSSIAIVELCRQLTRLSNRQRRILDAIYDLKRASPYPNYWPTTAQIADKLDLAAEAIEQELKPILNKVVSYDSDSQTWRVLL